MQKGKWKTGQVHKGAQLRHQAGASCWGLTHLYILEFTDGLQSLLSPRWPKATTESRGQGRAGLNFLLADRSPETSSIRIHSWCMGKEKP